MLNTKFDLYKTEWLDLVFDDRNKAYGAYDLRRHYADNINKAMAITFAVLLAASSAVYILSHNKAVIPNDRIIDVSIPIIPAPKIEPIKKVEPPKEVAPPVKTQPAVAATRFTSFVVAKQDQPAEEPPKIVDIKGEVGPATVKGPEGPSLNVEDKGPVGPPATTVGNGEEIIPNTGSLEFNPEPEGGFGAFSKFLGKVLRYPGAASDAGMSGRVIMSFVIEKDGSLSNITVVKGAGYGFDEEATRVLKLAKAWKPGKQNGQPVRVRYTIPINFTLPE